MILFRPIISPKINQQKISTPTRALGIASFIGFSRKAPEDESTLRLTTHAHTHTHIMYRKKDSHHPIVLIN